ncbi:MAG: A24 family peptidase [Maritimibacter sp.]
MAWLPALSISLTWLLVPLLIAVILFDLRLMRIPNALVAMFLIVFVASLPFSVPDPMPYGELWARIAAALIVLVVGFVTFVLRIMGGGDVKILFVLMLFIPSALWSHFALIFAVCLFLGIGAMLALRFLLRNVQTNWRSLHDKRRFPMGLSIGAAGLVLLFLTPSLLS